MTRMLRIAGAQVGGIQKDDTRRHTIERLVALLEQAATDGAQLVVFPELTLTTFFPRWFIPDVSELDTWFERTMPNADNSNHCSTVLESSASVSVSGMRSSRQKGSGSTPRSSSTLTAPSLGKYRKVHLPGSGKSSLWLMPSSNSSRSATSTMATSASRPSRPAFAGGVPGMLICNDRRWPEAWRVLALRGVELVTIGLTWRRTTRPGLHETSESRTEHSLLAARANAWHANDMGGRRRGRRATRTAPASSAAPASST